MLLSDVYDLVAGADERVLLGKISGTVYPYDELWTWKLTTYGYVATIFAGRSARICLGASQRPELLTLDAIEAHATTLVAAPRPRGPSLTARGAGTNDVSCILNLHREGDLIVPTLRSILWMLTQAAKEGVASELVMVLDSSDEATVDVVERLSSFGYLPAETRMIEVGHTDLAASRMSGVRAATGQFVAFLDGDDLYSSNWIGDAYKSARRADENSVFHPEINVYFGEEHRLTWHPDETTFDVPYGALLFENCWTSLAFARRDLYLEMPLEPIALDEGFGYEDWHWNLRAVARGIVHRTVSKTCHFIRLKGESSLNRQTGNRHAVVRPSLFPAWLIRKEAESESSLPRRGGKILNR